MHTHTTKTGRQLRILLSIRHTSYLRNFLEIIEHLAKDGHRLHFVFDAHGPLGEDSLFTELCQRYSNVSGQFIERHDPAGRTTWQKQAEMLRRSIDYLRYLDKRYI